MRRTRVFTVLLVMLLSVAIPASAQAGHARDVLLGKVNQARAKSGLKPLRASPALSSSSTSFSGSLLSQGTLGHASGVSASHRFKGLGEAISMHSGRKPNPSAVVRRWLASPGHRAVLLKAGVNWGGAGYRTGRFKGRRTTVWVLQVGQL